MRYLLSLTIPLLLSSTVLAAPIGDAGARLLLMRTGFGANPAQIAALAPLERAAAVDRVLANSQRKAQTPPPDWAGKTLALPQRKDLSQEEKQQMRRTEVQQGLALRGWWLQEMRETRSPVSEKMTLFWHNHFVSGQSKVKLAELMYQQNALLRREALGNFATLLHAIAKDPAMMRYLDTASNRKDEPNENFAREVMELFTLGEGHYSEQDVREAARAFTGWSLKPGSAEFVSRPKQHDSGSKTLFGKTGRFDGDDVIDLLLAQPQTSRFITRKLWQYLISPTPDDAQVQRLAASFAANYEIKPLVRSLLLTDAFWQSSGQQIKSPVELTVGTLNTLDIPAPDWKAFAMLNRSMGQDLFDPPNVRGWPGGAAWINSDSLLLRKQFLDRISSDNRGKAQAMRGNGKGMKAAEKMAERSMNQLAFDSTQWLTQYGLNNGKLATVLLATPAAQPPAANLAPEKAIKALLLDPAYQVQ